MRMIMLNDDFEQLISLSLDKVIKIWDLRNNECIQTITKFKKPDTDAPTAFLVDKARHRMVSFGQRQQVFKINSAILYTTTEDTHRSPVVAVLYNRSFGNVITVAEDSECAVWRPATGEQIFTFFDTERNDETHCTCANFDEAGRRLLIGDHYGVVRVWNFNNGACIKTLVKPRDRHSRQEITDLCSYNFEDKRFFAATSWDRKVTLWADFSEDSGTVTPHMQMQGHDSDILSMAFFHPKSLAASCADGTISVFDIESGHKRMTLLTEKSRTGKSPRDSRAAISESQYIEKVIFLEHKNGTMVSAGADGYLRFWEGQWMRSVPSHCAGSVNPSNLACLIPGNHYHGAAIVDVKADDENNYLVTADEAGFIKTWDISGYNWQKPSSDQVQPICFWQAHEVTINVLDIMVPANVEAHVEEELEPLVFSCAPDKRAMMWTIDGMHVGKFGQPLEKGSTRRTPWDLYTKSTWRSAESLNILGDQESALGSPVSEDDFSGSGDDEDHFNAVLNDLDNRLRAKVPSKVVFDTFELEEAMPSETMNKGKKKGKDYVVDEITGERIYKTNAKKAVVGEEKRKSKFKAGATRLDTDLSKILKTSFAKNSQKEVTPRSEDPKEIERKITYATASALMKVYEAKCERQGWGEPDAIQKDILCTKIRHSLQVLREPESGVDKVANFLYKLGSNWEDMLSQADLESLG